jgi:hypothetical protein
VKEGKEAEPQSPEKGFPSTGRRRLYSPSEGGGHNECGRELRISRNAKEQGWHRQGEAGGSNACRGTTQLEGLRGQEDLSHGKRSQKRLCDENTTETEECEPRKQKQREAYTMDGVRRAMRKVGTNPPVEEVPEILSRVVVTYREVPIMKQAISNE